MNEAHESVALEIPEATILFYPHFFTPEQSDRLFATLLDTIAWKQEQLKFFGRTVNQPRLSAWYGDAGTEYTYSGLHLVSLPWIPALSEIKDAIEATGSARFNSVLLNRYRDNRDGVDWHADNEHGLGPNPTIASVSFGATREFQLKHRRDRSLKRSIELTHGSLLIMADGTQTNWLHRIPRTTRPIGPRINLTFRKLLNVLPAEPDV